MSALLSDPTLFSLRLQAYPSEDGRSVFDSDPKLKAKLDRELAKGKIPMEPTDNEEPIDADLDMLVARAVEEVWKTYDPKMTGFMDKKNMEKFFKVRTHFEP